MKRSTEASFAILSVFIWVNFSWGDQSDRYLTTTLLPVEEKVLGENDTPESLSIPYLWVQQKPRKRISLGFDLKGLPLDLNEFKRCSLRIVAHDPQYKPAENAKNTGGGTVSLRGSLPLAKDKKSIVALNDITSNPEVTVAVGASSELCKKIQEKFSPGKGDRLFTIILETGSDKAGALFHSSQEFEKNPSNLPRLVIEYTLKPPDLLETASWPQHQHNPEHTGRSPWTPFQAPQGFSLVSIPLPTISGNVGNVADYPLIYQGSMYLVSKFLDQNYLLSLDFKGAEWWRHPIGKGTVQRSPVISRSGIMYVVTESQIKGYDLTQSGKDYASYALSGELSDYTNLTQGNDGSLFLALKENELNYIYGFTPSLRPFLKAGPFGKGQEKISTITVSPDGRKIFAQIPAGAVVIDVANPSEQKRITLAHNTDEPWEYYYVPIAGPDSDIMIFSDFASTANKGNIWGYSEKQRIWNASGTLLPQPVLGSDGRVYYIQGGVLQGHPYNQVGSADITAGTGLKTTSNLVMDAANNMYFWDNGYLHRYSPKAEPHFVKADLTKEDLETQRPADPETISGEEKAVRNPESSGPEQFIRLMAGPDGTLWANNKNGSALFAFKPSYPAADLTLKQADIKTQTVYRDTGKLTVGGVTVSGGTQVLLQGQNGIGFAPGFKVEQGASLLARTGF